MAKRKTPRKAKGKPSPQAKTAQRIVMTRGQVLVVCYPKPGQKPKETVKKLRPGNCFRIVAVGSSGESSASPDGKNR